LLLATRQFADATVAAPAGRIDHLSAPAFEAALTPLLDQAGAHQGALVLDFSGVDYISSVGLRVLMIAAKQMREARATLALAALQDVVGEIIKISRFDRVLSVSPTLEEALLLCSPAARASYQARRPGA
jgi:anti-anti-sigma factor